MTLQEWIDKYGVDSFGQPRPDEQGRTPFSSARTMGYDENGNWSARPDPSGEIEALTKGLSDKSFLKWSRDSSGNWSDPVTQNIETIGRSGGIFGKRGNHSPAGWMPAVTGTALGLMFGGAGANAAGLLGPGAGAASGTEFLGGALNAAEGGGMWAGGSAGGLGAGGTVGSTAALGLSPEMLAGLPLNAAEGGGGWAGGSTSGVGSGGTVGSTMGESVIDKVLKGATSPSALNALATVAGGLLGGAGQSDSGGGTAARAPFTPSGKTMGEKTYSPNANNVAEMQRFFDYMAKRGNPKRDAYAAFGGGSKYTGLLG